MAEPSTHINYTFEDIQRYVQGKMSAAEMHSIEKAALQDSFLADAIEGYTEANLTTAQQHLNEINASLIKEKKESKVVAFNKKTQWMNVAALVIVLAGVGVAASFLFKSSDKQTQIAEVKKEPAKNETLKDSVTNNPYPLQQETDSLQLTAKAEKISRSSSANKLSLRKISKTAPVNFDASKETPAVASITAAAPQQNQNAVNDVSASINKNEDSIPNIRSKRISGVNIDPTTFAGKVVDEKNQPVANAIVEATDKSITVLTDNNGNFTLFKSDTALNATASDVGYNTKTTLLKPGNNNIIMLQLNSSGLNDVVVTGLGVQKNKITNPNPQPVGGWQNFNNYVINELNKDSTKENNVHKNDMVELEFLIDKAGKPYNIKVTKALDDEKNLKAIDILKSGPKWTNISRNEKAKVTIHFRQP